MPPAQRPEDNPILHRAKAAEAERKKQAEEEARWRERQEARSSAWEDLRRCDEASLPAMVVRFALMVDPWPELDASKLVEEGPQQDALAFTLHILTLAKTSGDPAAVKREIAAAANVGANFANRVSRWLRHDAPEKILIAANLIQMGLPVYREGEAKEGNTGPVQPEQAEGVGEELTDRQTLILETMLHHEISSERRKKTRVAIVRLINRNHKPATYGRDFAALVKRGFLQAREGPGRGVWLTRKGKAEAEHLRGPS